MVCPFLEGMRFNIQHFWIQSYSIAKVFWLGESSSSNVILGNKGWFFLSKAGDQNELNYYRSINPFTQKELDRWKLVLEKRKNWLASQGIRYILVIAPNKTTIYPEFLPSSLNRVTKESRLDRLIAYMKQNSNVEILDLRASLISAKEKELIYHPKDTHWNDLGAFIGYQQIVKSISISHPNLKPLSRSDFKVEISNESSDLINMMGLNSTTTDRRLSLVKKTENLAFEVESGIFYQPELPIEKRPFATELKNSNTPNILMFHDSFTSSLRPFLSETFSRIVYVWEDKLDNKIVKKERPNIVIQEIVERKLMTDPGI